MKGKKPCPKKRWHSSLGATTATPLRLTEPWHGSGRIVVGDSWFGSVKTALNLRKNGLHFIGQVKTAHKKFPKKGLKDLCPEERGSHTVATASEENVALIGLGW